MPHSTSSSLPTLRRIGSSASVSNLALDSRTTRSSTLNNTTPSETSHPAPASTTRARFGFPSSTSSNQATAQTNSPHTSENTSRNNPSQLRKSTRISSTSTSQIARPASALGRPATALGTHSTTSAHTNSRLPQSTNIPAPHRKRRTSSVSSQRPAPLDHPPTSNSTRPSDSIHPSELQKQLDETLIQLTSAQQECTQWKSRAEEAELRIERSEKDRYEERVSFCEEIKQLEEQHDEKVRQIKTNLSTEMTDSQEQVEKLRAASAKSQEELDKSTAHIDRLQSEIEQMDIDSGRSAAQVMELTRLKAELEVQLEASRSELEQTVRDNQNRLDQVTQHYHNIQSKLHEDLEHMTADYQASLQQHALSPSPEIVTQLKSQISQLEQKIKAQDIESSKAKAEVDRLIHLTNQHHEEKREWDLAREKLELQFQELHQQQQLANGGNPDNQVIPIKIENDTSNHETQLIDFTINVGESHCNILMPKSEEEESGQLTGKSSSTNESSSAAQEVDISDETMIKVVPLEVYERTISDLKNAQTELESLKSELSTVQETIASLRKCASDAEKDQLAAQMASQDEWESIRRDLESQLTRARQAVDDLKSGTVPREDHQKTVDDLQNLQSELSSLKAELISYQETAQDATNKLASSQQVVQELQENHRNLKKDSTEDFDRLSQVHAKEIATSTEQIKLLQRDLDQVNSLHAQALSKLDELAGFNPEQIAVLTSRLREERDESRRAIEFVQVERQALENTSHALISKLQRDHEHVLNETTAERNALVLAISTLQQTLRSWVQSHSLSQNAETNDVKGSPTSGKAAMEDNNMSYNISIASHLRGDLGMSYDDGLGTPRFVRPEGSYRQSLSGPQDHPNVIESRPYDTALEQITTLTKQVDDLKEQLLQTYVVHQEQEKLALHDVEQLRSELLSTREQHSQAQEQQARTISSLELQFSGIQHQFHSLEICYNALRKENDALKHEMVEESERSVQLKADRESMQATTDSLRIQIESMNEEIQRYKQHISDLQNQHSLANQSSAATSEEQTSQLMTQIGQLTHDLKEQKILTDSLEEQLNAAVLIQREHLSTVKRLEETLEGQTLETQATLDSKKEELLVQKGDFERQLSELSESLEEKSALNIQLQESVTALTARIQEENDSHRQIQTESERKLSETTELRAVVDEKHKLLEDQVEELLEKTKALEDENKSLSDKLGVATEEQEALKDKMATELSSTKEELAMVIISRDSMGLQLDQVNQEIRLLTEELEHVKSGQNFNAQSTEKYDNLLSEFKALEERLPALTAELEIVRSELESATGMVEDLTTEVKEKDSMVDSLKADLATISKLHRSISSADTTARVQELEGIVASKSSEAEDALDQLLDQMQKNKKLANMVEILKLKLKSRTKAVHSAADQQVAQDSAVDAPSVSSGPSAPEPEHPVGATNSRKRKHEPGSDGVPTRGRGQVGEEGHDGKENPGGAPGRQSVRRKISANRDDDDDPRADPQTHPKPPGEGETLTTVLQPVSLNLQTPHHAPSPATAAAKDGTKDELKPPLKPPPTSSTNSTLLASIQSLRRKQQQKQQSISAQAGRPAATPAAGGGGSTAAKLVAEPRRSSLRLVRKEQENL
ncbi:hypothetical protein PCANC_23732 [Puccinia coronata f. sp. avenae]|uniref:Uncharacterized protein n=1 Tax=Puccinia coronata f. sp. avenae TaxID=200324 RepID=A0A2N5SC60_9BASI|nr:hypothetical protein PCANC_23732 [Puccinia coronata f. sp. avenae]